MLSEGDFVYLIQKVRSHPSRYGAPEQRGVKAPFGGSWILRGQGGDGRVSCRSTNRWELTDHYLVLLCIDVSMHSWTGGVPCHV